MAAQHHPSSHRPRGHKDRRKRYWRTLWHSIFTKRRATIRRGEDPRHNVILDHHESHYFALILAIISLCVTDAFLTVTIIDHGGVEVNPFMRALLETDVRVFFAVKYVLTASCIIVALIHRRFHAFRFLNGEHILWWTFALYLALINYEVWLLHSIQM